MTSVLTIFTIIFGELVPKQIGLAHAERVAMSTSRLIDVLGVVFGPLVGFLTGTTRRISRLFGADVAADERISAEELRLIIEQGGEQGILEAEEEQMIHAVIELGDQRVHEVMVPRIAMVSLASDATLEQAIDTVIDEGHSRIPVYEETIDEIVGILYAKDLLPFLKGSVAERPSLRSILRTPVFVPESMSVDDLLHEFQRRKVHLAIVLDEYGGTAGLVTIEDLLEEIVGEIQDEYDEEEPLIVKISDDEARIDGRADVDDLAELFDTNLGLEDEDEYDTVGGLIYHRIGGVPKPGDRVLVDGLTLTVETTDGRRVGKVLAVRDRDYRRPRRRRGGPLAGRLDPRHGELLAATEDVPGCRGLADPRRTRFELACRRGRVVEMAGDRDPSADALQVTLGIRSFERVQPGRARLGLSKPPVGQDAGVQPPWSERFTRAAIALAGIDDPGAEAEIAGAEAGGTVVGLECHDVVERRSTCRARTIEHRGFRWGPSGRRTWAGPASNRPARRRPGRSPRAGLPRPTLRQASRPSRRSTNHHEARYGASPHVPTRIRRQPARGGAIGPRRGTSRPDRVHRRAAPARSARPAHPAAHHRSWRGRVLTREPSPATMWYPLSSSRMMNRSRAPITSFTPVTCRRPSSRAGSRVHVRPSHDRQAARVEVSPPAVGDTLVIARYSSPAAARWK